MNNREILLVQGRNPIRMNRGPIFFAFFCLAFIVSCSLIAGVTASPTEKAEPVKTTAILPADTIAGTQAPARPNVVDERAGVAGMTPEEIRDFFYRIKDNVANNKKMELAEMVFYPILVYIRSAQENLLYPDEFVANYDQIINQKVRDAVRNQTEENLFINYQGVMIGTGEIWFGGVCSDTTCEDYSVYIIAINNG